MGPDPEPGLALPGWLRGRLTPPVRRCAAHSTKPARVTRPRLLAAYVEIVLAAGDIVAARRAADELSEIAADLDVTLLNAVSDQATGAVLLAEGDARAALIRLRRAWTSWQALEVPYEGARVRVLTLWRVGRSGTRTPPSGA